LAEAMPGIIARNFIYRIVWNEIRRKDSNAIFLFIGDVGSGKSTGALRWGTDLDPGFNFNSIDYRICFNMAQFFDLVEGKTPEGKPKRGAFILFDEAAGSDDAIDSRNALSKVNKRAAQFATISRAKGYIIVYCVPQITQVDKRVRSIGVKGIFHFKGIDRNRHRSFGTFYYNKSNAFGGNDLRPKPRLLSDRRLIEYDGITIPLPKDRELVKKYKQVKDNFINNQIASWAKQTREEMKPKGNHSFFKEKYEEAKGKVIELKKMDGTISVGLIQAKIGVGENTAKNIKAVLLDEGFED
jgi:hypothetical protein